LEIPVLHPVVDRFEKIFAMRVAERSAARSLVA